MLIYYEFKKIFSTIIQLALISRYFKNKQHKICIYNSLYHILTVYIYMCVYVLYIMTSFEFSILVFILARLEPLEIELNDD